jgi:hypothetical protein
MGSFGSSQSWQFLIAPPGRIMLLLTGTTWVAGESPRKAPKRDGHASKETGYFFIETTKRR